MTGRQKIFFLIIALYEQRALTPSSKPILIHYREHLGNSYNETELELILEKLSKETKILTVIDKPHSLSSNYDQLCYKIKLTSRFDNYYRQLQNDPDYRSFRGLEPLVPPPETTILSNYPPKYDKDYRAIVVQNVIIPVPTNSNQEDLCHILFKNARALKKKWNLDEVMEQIDESATDHSKYYRAAKAINEAVAKKTGVNDLLLVDTKTVQINPAYL